MTHFAHSTHKLNNNCALLLSIDCNMQQFIHFIENVETLIRRVHAPSVQRSWLQCEPGSGKLVWERQPAA